MMKKRVLWSFGLLLIIVALAALVSIMNAPAASDVRALPCLSADGACLRFPAVTGANLPGQNFSLPDDFSGDYTLLIVSFDQQQQVTADSWLPLARALAADHPGLTYYNLPVFTSLAPTMRVFIRTGMTIAIPDPALQAVTITVFLDDRQAFLDALGIPGLNDLQTFLLNPRGEVLWRGAGVFSAGQGEDLRRMLEDS